MRDYHFTCAGCGIVVAAFKSEALRRKYCGASCYNQTRRLSYTPIGYRNRGVSRDHPLSEGRNAIREHRLVLWDRVGPGAHPCHYCGTLVEWRVGVHAWHGALVAEHLDRNTANNDPSNIVVACQPCNIRNQARTVTDDEDFVMTSDGNRRRAIKHICARPECGAEFLAALISKRKYCSSACFHETRRGKPWPTRRNKLAASRAAKERLIH